MARDITSPLLLLASLITLVSDHVVLSLHGLSTNIWPQSQEDPTPLSQTAP
jgi:hypothetical protein